jgi:hypothetical protein
MKHDPFCKAYYPDLLEPERCAWCMVIRRVREDERLNAYGNGYTDSIADDMKLSSVEDIDVEYWIGYNNGYMDGYTDAEAHYPEWSLNKDNKTMSTKGDNDAQSND